MLLPTTALDRVLGDKSAKSFAKKEKQHGLVLSLKTS